MSDPAAAPLYLDHSATSPVRREALEAMWPYLTGAYGNASSVHAAGRAAAAGLADARARVARVLGGRPGEVVFTSGGTEADALAVQGIVLGALARRGGSTPASPGARPPLHVVTTALEHEAVLATCAHLTRFHDVQVTRLAPDDAGVVAPDSLARALRPETALVSVHLANNVVGTVQPIADLAAVAHAAGVPFHTDAVQAAGQLPLDVAELGVDALSLSGHKVGAPKGTGVLWVRSRVPLEPVLHGGGQERGRRAGTEDVAGAVAFATALELAEAERRRDARTWARRRDGFVAAVLAEVPGARLTGHPHRRLPRHASFVLPGVNGETVLVDLEREGVLASAGSACAAGSTEPPAALLALGLPDEDARTAVRFTFGPETDDAGLAAAARALGRAVAAARQLGGR